MLNAALFRTPARRSGDRLRHPNQVAVVAPAERKEAEAEERKETEPCCFCPEPAAAPEVAPPTAKVVARPRVEAPGKADTVKMGTKVVGGDGTKEKPQVQRYILTMRGRQI